MAAIDTRDQFAGLFDLYTAVIVAVTVVVFAVVLFALVRFRRRDEGFARGRHKSTVGESLYAVALACIAVFLVAATFRTESRVDPVAKTEGLRVDITAFQWQWRFDYPDSGVSVIGSPHDAPPTIVVPLHTRVLFTATSRDVIHSFWLPQERFKRDAFPGRTTSFDLVFDTPGTQRGHCAEFCGLRHSNMDFFVRAVPKAEFDRWVSTQ